MIFIKIENGGKSADGFYIESDLVNSKKSFIKGGERIEWDGEKWRVLTGSDTVLYFSNPENTETPDLASWFEGGSGYPSEIVVTKLEFEDLKIKNAGSDIVNSCYRVTEIFNGMPKYSKLAEMIPVEDRIYISWNNDRWEIKGVAISPMVPPRMYYTSTESPSTPDLVSEWLVQPSANAPTPTFVVGCTSFISTTSKAVKRNRG